MISTPSRTVSTSVFRKDSTYDFSFVETSINFECIFTLRFLARFNRAESFAETEFLFDTPTPTRYKFCEKSECPFPKIQSGLSG